LEQKLRDAQIQIEELKRRNKALKEKLQLAEKGKKYWKWGHGDGKAYG